MGISRISSPAKNSHQTWENLAWFSQKELAVTPTEVHEIQGLFQGQMATNCPKVADLTPNSLQEIPATTSHGGGGGCILRKILDMSSAGFSPGNSSGQPAPDTSEAFSVPLLGQFSVPKPENLAAIEFGEEVPATTSPGGRGGDTLEKFRATGPIFCPSPKKGTRL